MDTERRESLTDVLHAQIKAEKKLSQALTEYVGQWVAVRNHVVVAHAPNLDLLLEEVNIEQVETIFEVAEEQDAVCFF